MSVQPFFTIVISAYEEAQYIGQAVESVRRQSFSGFDVLCVYEESRDGTRAALERAIGGDSRFRIVDFPRSGSASIGRNYAIEHADGEYLLFLDGDDWLDTDALERLAAAAGDADFPEVVAGEYVNWRQPETGEPERRNDEIPLHSPGRTVSGADFLAESLANRSFLSATWRYIYRRLWLRDTGLRQSPGRRHQDNEWTPQVLYAASRVRISGIVFYHYRKRTGSVTMTPSRESLHSIALNVSSGFIFWRAHRFPAPLRRELARRQLFFIRLFFAPRWRRFYGGRVRGAELRTAIADRKSLCDCASMSFHCGLRDMLFLPFLWLAVVVPPFFPVTDRACDLIHRWRKTE